MNKEQDYDTNEYDEESFDNESSDDEESISEESSVGESLQELLPDNLSMKSLPDSIDKNQAFEKNDFNDVSSVSSEDIDETHGSDRISAEQNDDDASSVSSEDSKETPPNSVILNKGDEDVSSVNSEDSKETPPNSVILNERDVNYSDVEVKDASEIQTNIYTETNAHEIDESDSEEFTENDLSENIKSLTIQNEESSLKVVVPKENPNLEDEKNTDDDAVDDDDNDDDDCNDSQTSELELIVTSQTPTSFNSENYAFHMELSRKPTRSNTSLHQQRNTHRKSLSFSNERMREIERHNQILLQKILKQKPRKEFLNKKNECPQNLRTTTSAVNRKKQQRQIDLDNQVLKRKIEAIALRRPQIL